MVYVDCQRIYYAKGFIDDYFVKHIKRRSFTLDDVLWFSKDHYEIDGGEIRTTGKCQLEK